MMHSLLETVHEQRTLERGRQLIEAISVTETGELTDTTLVSGAREFRCHKVILAARSSVFKAMFTHDMEETRANVVNIVDIEGDIIQDMLLYMYGKEVADLDTKAERLIIAADKYNLTDLKAQCGRSLSQNIKIENVLDLLLLADLHRATTLKGQIFKYIVGNGREIMAQVGWQDKLEGYPNIMVDMLEAFSTNLPAKKQKTNLY